MVSNGEVVKE
jgi:hypothetical protein